MAKYRVETDNGIFEVETEDSPMATQAMPASQPFGAEPMDQSDYGQIAGQAFKAATTGPYDATQAMVQKPEDLPAHLPMLGTLAGGMVGGVPGAAVGAGLGQIGKRAGDIAFGNAPPVEATTKVMGVPMAPKEAIGPMIQSAVAGLPGISGVFSAGKNTLEQSIVSGLAKTGQTLSGAKKDVLEQAYKQGPSTYFAPSISKAQDIFGKAIGKEGQAAMKEGVEQAFDSELGQARAKAVEIGKKLEKGETVTALEALQARQATDRVISSTPGKNKLARRSLYDWRKQFDDVMTSQSGPMKEASTTYRKAIVRDQLLSPTRLNKGGEPSAFLPQILGAAGIGGFGAGSGHGGKTAAGLATGLAVTSPLAWGLGATAMGAVSPTARQALLAELVDRLTENRR